MFDYFGAEIVPEGEFAGDHGAAYVGVCGDFLVGGAGFQFLFPSGDFVQPVAFDFSDFFMRRSFAEVVAFEYEGSGNHPFTFAVGVVQSEAYFQAWDGKYPFRGRKYDQKEFAFVVAYAFSL